MDQEKNTADEVSALKDVMLEARDTLKDIKKSVTQLGGIFNDKCYKCGSKCCKYIVIKIDDPEDIIDIEEMRWFISHEKILLCIDDDQWEVVVLTDCHNLDAFGRCRIYSIRPDVCRDHSADECEFIEPGDFGDTVFRTLEELDDYLKEQYPWWWKEKKKRHKDHI